MFDLIVLDGGAGRELARMGAPFRQPEWSALALLEGPDFVTRMHQRYVEAGADVITTNSYAVVPFHLGSERFAARGAELADLAGRLARDAVAGARRPVRVAGSLPPVCGSYRADLFRPDEARPILQVLIRGLAPHVDHWLAETLSAIEEAELVREVVDTSVVRPLWLSFTLEDESAVRGQPRLRSGQPVSEAVAAAIRLRAAAVLFNCSQPEVMEDAVFVAGQVLEDSRADLRIGVYANAFPPQPKDATANDGLSDIRADLTPHNYLAFAKAWHQNGASILGGCCGIGPEHIDALRRGLTSVDKDREGRA
ncbi:MAG: homocysteine S-methyltransferase family protein [Sinobacteraceae bacterium]|nr:homocysteine S-methyltransferase family protein [Nevskiaceae bacterium]